MKKSAAMILALGLAASLAGCSSSAEETTAATTAAATTAAATTAEEAADTTAAEAEETTEAAAAAMEGPITVVSREDGSGTRGAFIELFGIEEEDASGEKVDMTTLDAEITNSTSVMMTTVSGNTEAIGYVSLGSLNDTVSSGDYAIARPFVIVTTDSLSDVAADFISFIMSDEGQQVITDEGYISIGSQGAYAAAGVSGDLSVGGSSSVTPVMEKLAEAYNALNPDVNIEVQQSDSTTGVTSALEGVVDIGMASRDLKDSELEQGVTGTVIAMDGIAVVVNNENPIDDLSSAAVKSIYTGEVTDWADVQ